MKKIYCLFLAVLLTACGPKLFQARWTKEKAPEQFAAWIETTQGDFEIEAHRSWSPHGVDRLYQLIRHGYFDRLPVYRVESGFLTQFGALDSLTNTLWEKVSVPDEPVVKANVAGTMAFARKGANSRSNQLFINLEDHPYLDTINYGGATGFPAVAVVTRGLPVAARFYAYPKLMQETPDSVRGHPMAYFRLHYPKMDYILKATLIR